MWQGYKKKKVWIPTLIAVLVLVLIIFNSKKTTPPELSTTIVKRMDLKQHVTETGSVVANTDVVFGWETSGRVGSINKKVGDQLKAGDVIATLNNFEQSARLQEASALLASASARLNLDLAGASNEDKKKSAATVDQAIAQVEQIKAQKIKTQAAVDASVVSAEKAVQSAYNDLQLADKGEDSQIVQNAYADLVNDIKEAYTAATNALNTADSVLGVDNQTANDAYEGGLEGANPIYFNTAKTTYASARNEKMRVGASISALSANSSHASIDSVYASADNLLNLTIKNLFDVKLSLDFARPAGDLSLTELDTLKSNVYSAQTALNTAAAGLTNSWQAVGTARNSLLSYKIAYEKALQNLDSARRQAQADIAYADAQIDAQIANLRQIQAAHEKLLAPPRAVDVAALRADVARQAANVSALRKEYEKTILVAPVDGVLSKLSVEVGENVAMSTPVATILSPDLRVDVDIAESDVSKLTVGDTATITLDAFSDDVVFTGKVIAVEPGQTEISGVIYYKTKIIFDNAKDTGVRPGMTANVSILTDEKSSVLTVPERSILEDNGQKIIRVVKSKKSGTFETRKVITGLRGDEGVIEIVSGVSEGDEVVTFIREK